MLAWIAGSFSAAVISAFSRLITGVGVSRSVGATVG